LGWNRVVISVKKSRFGVFFRSWRIRLVQTCDSFLWSAFSEAEAEEEEEEEEEEDRWM
jgi:hypothetical protein